MSPASAPCARDGVFIPESHALNPLGRHDALGTELTVNFRDGHTISEARLSCNKFCHHFGVIGFVFKICLEEKALADIGHKAVERDIENATVDPGHDSSGLLVKKESKISQVRYHT